MGDKTKTRINYVFAAGKLRDLREQKGFSRADLAKVLGVDKTLIAKWETKKCNPSFENARELSYFFGVDDDYWKLSDKPKFFDKGIVYDGHKPEDLILSLNEIKDLNNRIVFLEEKIKTLTNHDDELKKRLLELEKRHDSVAEDCCGLDNRIDELESELDSNIDWKQLSKALIKVISRTETMPYGRGVKIGC